MPDIFISYARKNAAFVERLRDDLRANGFDYWIDTEGLAAGTTSWEKAIRQAIQNCTSVIWVVSPASYESPYVRDEISIARMKGRKIYPVWADGDNWLECVPLGTGEIQFVDMRETKYKAGLEELHKALGGKRPELIAKTEESPRLAIGVEPRNPYKGLHAFMEKDAGDFFGRGDLINQLCQRLAPEQNRFLAVLGPSGAGKSSVVMAGLIPALQNGALKNSKNWTYLPRIVPGKYPLEALCDALHSHLRDIPLSTLETDLKAGVRYFPRHLKRLEGDRVLLYIDQFEELFSLTEDEAERQQFIDLLVTASTDPESKLITVLSMRADFYAHPMHYPQLGSLITTHQASVLPMTITELYETIQKPALLPDVSLRFDEGLVADIVFELRERNVALEGALPFLEFTLARLFEAREGNQLKRHAYEMMGGVAGAIGHHAESLFCKLSPEAQASFTKVFLPLTNIHPDTGEATRKRANQAEVYRDEACRSLVDALIKGRLLMTGKDADQGEIYIEVAHEALFRSWERLKNWKNITQQDLRDLQQVEREARDWDRKGRTFLPSAERLQPLYQAVERLELQGRLNPILQDFLYPQAMLLKELENPETSEQRRLRIGDDLALLGDTRDGVSVQNGLPDIVWMLVQGSQEPVTIETDGPKIGPVLISDFFISKYLITYTQFQAFIDDVDGFENLRWWDGIPEKFQKQELASQRTKMNNVPRDSVSWYQCIAFTRWLNQRLSGLRIGDRLVIGENGVIRLPTEWEWQWMAQGGSRKKAYPWGEWRTGYANVSGSGLGRTTAVGMYPHGAADCGAFDVAGNLFEWCLNDYEDHQIINGYSNEKSKVLRGGSFLNYLYLAAVSYRNYFSNPNCRLTSFSGCALLLALCVSDLCPSEL